MGEHEFFVIMLKRRDGQVYPDLAKTNQIIYLTQEDAEKALNTEFVLDGYGVNHWHVVRLLARLPSSFNTALVDKAYELLNLLEGNFNFDFPPRHERVTEGIKDWLERYKKGER